MGMDATGEAIGGDGGWSADTEGELGSWLRCKGLTQAHLEQWQEALEERAAAVFAPREPRVSGESRKRVKELERELRRKDKALAETAALLVLQGKMEALWAENRPLGDDADATDERYLIKVAGPTAGIPVIRRVKG